MRFGLTSDVHIEFHRLDKGNKWIQSLDTELPLVIAGDLALCDTFVNVLDRIAKRVPWVIFVPGNHEHYDSSIPKVRASIIEARKTLPSNVHILDRSFVDIDGTRFHGCTLWFSNNPMNQLYEGHMNDFKCIENFRNDVYVESVANLEYLRANVRPGDVIVTHHLPHSRSVPEHFSRSTTTRFYLNENAFYVIDENKPSLWCHGHTHNDCDYIVGDTRVVCHPHGYMGYEITRRKPKIIEM